MKWFSAKEIAKKMNLTYSSVHVNLNKLKKSGDVLFKEKKRDNYLQNQSNLWRLK